MSVRIVFNRNSEAWANVFRYNDEIRAELMKRGREIAAARPLGEDEHECQIRRLQFTQVARIRPLSQKKKK